MKQISWWASHNRNTARILVVIIKITLGVLAYDAGDRLYQQQLHVPLLLIVIAAIFSIVAVLLYPSKKSPVLSKHRRYVKQKSCDFILCASSFIIILTVVNNRENIKPLLLQASYASFIKKRAPKAETIIASLSYRDKSSLTRVEKRVLKKEFNKQVKIYTLAKITHNKQKADSALPIILTIIAALGLMVLLLGLVCSLSCSGADVAAGLVGVLGGTAIIWGSIALIKHFQRRSQEK